MVHLLTQNVKNRCIDNYNYSDTCSPNSIIQWNSIKISKCKLFDMNYNSLDQQAWFRRKFSKISKKDRLLIFKKLCLVLMTQPEIFNHKIMAEKPILSNEVQKLCSLLNFLDIKFLYLLLGTPNDIHFIRNHTLRINRILF